MVVLFASQKMHHNTFLEIVFDIRNKFELIWIPKFLLLTIPWLKPVRLMLRSRWGAVKFLRLVWRLLALVTAMRLIVVWIV